VIKDEIEIKNRLGIHARPAAMLAQEAGKFKSDILISKEGMEVNAKSIMGIMMIAAEQGSHLGIVVDGPDEDIAFKALVETFEKIFEEE
jgi:phosphocarrier protein